MKYLPEIWKPPTKDQFIKNETMNETCTRAKIVQVDAMLFVEQRLNNVVQPALSQLISISLFLEVESGWKLAEQLPNNKILKGMDNILIMPNTTPIETAKIWGNFPRL